MTPLALVRLLHLASPALPVGAFSYSQGLEWAVEVGTVTDEASALLWIADALEASVAAAEAPAVAAFWRAWRADDALRAAHLNEQFLALRETAETRAETVQMGHSLVRLWRDLAFCPAARALSEWPEVSYPAAWAAAAVDTPETEAVISYLWAWLENQTMAAVKLIPLGQTAGQRLLRRLADRLPELAVAAIARADPEDWQNFTPALALASARHETQYTRLFRS